MTPIDAPRASRPSLSAGSPCPTCATLVPPGAERCPQCGRVFGEANRCPHCHAIAGVRPSGSGYVCLACGGDRSLRPGTTIGSGALAPVPVRRGGLRLLGGAVLGGGVLAAAASTAIFGVSIVGVPLAIAFGGLAMVAAVGLFRRAARLEDDALTSRRAARAAAAKGLLSQGALTSKELAEALGVEVAEADAIASALAADDANGIVADVDETVGVLRFGPRYAVSLPSSSSADEASELEDRAARESRERRGGL